MYWHTSVAFCLRRISAFGKLIGSSTRGGFSGFPMHSAPLAKSRRTGAAFRGKLSQHERPVQRNVTGHRVARSARIGVLQVVIMAGFLLALASASSAQEVTAGKVAGAECLPER